MAKKNLSSKISCGHCPNIAPMEILGSVGDLDTQEEYSFDQGIYYEVLKCPACEKVNIRSYFWHDGMDGEEDVTYETIYPPNNRLPLGLPSEIKEAYLKAEKVKPIDAEFYTTALRKVLELVCKNKSAVGRVLADQIKDLASKGEIPANLVKVAVSLKNFGNIGAHAGPSLSSKEIPIAESLCRAVLEYIYTAPHLAQLAEESLKAIKTPPTQKKPKK